MHFRPDAAQFYRKTTKNGRPKATFSWVYIYSETSIARSSGDQHIYFVLTELRVKRTKHFARFQWLLSLKYPHIDLFNDRKRSELRKLTIAHYNQDYGVGEINISMMIFRKL